MQENMLVELGAVRKEMCNVGCEIKEVRREMTELRVSLSGVSMRVDALEKRLDSVEQQRAKIVQEPEVVRDLQSTVVRLQQEINDRDQDDLLADLEIGHLPEERGEDVQHVVTVLAAKLGVTLEERDIVFAERVGTAQISGTVGEKPRARRIVVRLARRNLRDSILQGARVRRTLTAGDGSSSENGPRIFVNERLSRLNRQLFHRAREECRRLQWRLTWTRRGRVYVWQADGRETYPIRSEVDMKRVFGIAVV